MGVRFAIALTAQEYYNWYQRFKLLQLHRKRSIHVHVWNQETFNDFLAQAIAVYFFFYF